VGRNTPEYATPENLHRSSSQLPSHDCGFHPFKTSGSCAFSSRKRMATPLSTYGQPLGSGQPEPWSQGGVHKVQRVHGTK
jgi:hypothetical protein